MMLPNAIDDHARCQRVLFVRKPLREFEPAAFVRHPSVSEEEALRMVTLNPARQLGIASRCGSIEVGKEADLALYNGHPVVIAAFDFDFMGGSMGAAVGEGLVAACERRKDDDGRAGDDRVEQSGSGGRDCGDVVAEGPAEVLQDGAVGGVRQAHRQRHARHLERLGRLEQHDAVEQIVARLEQGQDVAYVTESATGFLELAPTASGDLYACAHLPSLLVGTVGGGSGQGTAAECLDLLGVRGGVVTVVYPLPASIAGPDTTLKVTGSPEEAVAPRVNGASP